MTLPANVRINVGAPFPSVVKATAPASIARANGIWTVGVSFMLVGQQVPPAVSLANDWVLVWDDTAKTFLRLPLATVMGSNQRAVTGAPVAIQATDYILHLNLTASTSITLPSYQSRSGLPLIFKDVGLQAGVNPLTIAAAGGETIDGLPSIPLNTPGQSIRVVPAFDGVNSGWFTE